MSDRWGNDEGRDRYVEHRPTVRREFPVRAKVCYDHHRGAAEGNPRLVDSVRLRKPTAYVGEPIELLVVTTDEVDEVGDDITVTVDGTPGERQTLQYGSPGHKRVLVTAGTTGGGHDSRTVEVEVSPRPNDCDGNSLYPLIDVAQNFRDPVSADLSLGNAEAFEAQSDRIDASFRYVWEVDGERLPTQNPRLTYSFADHLDPDETHVTVTVQLHVKTRDGKQVFSGARTVGVWNTYALNKEREIVHPPVDPNTYARRDGEDWVGQFDIENLEDEALEFVSVQVQPLLDDSTSPASPGGHQKYPWTLDAGVTETHEFSVTASDLPDDAFGFAAHFHGEGADSARDVVASAYFEVRRTPQAEIEIVDPDLVAVLDAVRSQDLFLDRDAIALPDLADALDERPDCAPPIADALEEPVDADWVTERVVRSVAAAERTDPMLGDGGDVEGTECIPGETPPSDEYVCQLTEEERWVTVPARILNARKGDVVLSPGGNGAIGGLLRNVVPPQVYSHSGIVTENYYTIRHSTADTDWLADARAGIDGSEGLDPDKLKYAWPGTIEQSVVAAYEGEPMADPDGATDEDGELVEYNVSGFSNETKLAGGGIGLIDPAVVKPNPSIEADFPAVREQLHAIADSAREIDGHYRFYAYTDAEIFFDDAFQAPDRGDDWWASETRPTVCSSLVWAAAKQLDPPVELEGSDAYTRPEDLEAEDVADGAEVDFSTRDGLYYYTVDERKAAASWLHEYFYDLAYAEMEDSYGPASGVVDFFTDAADDLADQMCNAFASDWTGENDAGDHAKDSDGWQSPGDGHAVSPDNIVDYWDAPSGDGEEISGAYGYSEDLLYRPARLERRRVSRWVRVPPEKATLEGHVTFRGDRIAGATVSAAGEETLTDGEGRYELEIPAGSYRVEAGKSIDGFYADSARDVDVEAGETETVNLVLEEPDELFRSLTVRGSIDVVDDEWGSDETATRDVFMGDIRLGPYGTHASRGQTVKMGGEVRVEVDLTFDWELDGSIRVEYDADLWEGTTEDTDDHEDSESGTFSVPTDATERLTIGLVNTEFGGGDTADVTLRFTNDRQP